MNDKQNIYSKNPDPGVSKILKTGLIEKSQESLKLALSCIDLTTLNTDDTPKKVRLMCQKINELPDHFPGYPNVGAICVYPSLIPTAAAHLKASCVRIVSVAGGFPSSQTFTEIKLAECIRAVEAGAHEIDIVMPVGKFLQGDYGFIEDEIHKVKNAIGNIPLKVILETGLLPGYDDIYRASGLAIKSGADFIKTSTGKIEPGSSPEAVFVMCEAIKKYQRSTGTFTGIKPAGGIVTVGQALQYMSIVKMALGDKWLNPGLFRIGASRLANRVLEELHYIISGEHMELQYF